jgi:hypothetical protein
LLSLFLSPLRTRPAFFLGLGTSGVIAAEGTFSLIFAHGDPDQ